MKRELPCPVSILYRRPPNPPSRYPGLLLGVTEQSLTIQSCLHLAQPRQVAGRIIAASGYWAIWFVFKDRWFDIGKFYDESKNWLGYYCDIVMPIKRLMSGSSTTLLTDLFLDIWITPDGETYVLDENELESAVRHRFISKSLASKARSQVQMLVRKIEMHKFPPTQVKEATLLEDLEGPRYLGLFN
jgi:predicted RNA-binding protein associated with RNAse of E/G family